MKLKPYSLKPRKESTGDYSKLVPDFNERSREIYPDGFEGLARKIALSSYENTSYTVDINSSIYLGRKQNYRWN